MENLAPVSSKTHRIIKRRKIDVPNTSPASNKDSQMFTTPLKTVIDHSMDSLVTIKK